MQHVKKIFDDIQLRCTTPAKLPYLDDLKVRIHFLTPTEKLFLSKQIYKLEYDIGTAEMLSYLWKIGFISIEYYVLEIDDFPLLMNIYNDFLETQPELFGELIRAGMNYESMYAERMKSCLEEFFKDFVSDTNGLRGSPLKRLNEYLDQNHKKFVHETIIKHFLLQNPVELTTAIKQQHVWEMKDKNSDAIQQQILQECLENYTAMMEFLFQFVESQNVSSINWRTYLQILRILSKNSDIHRTFKASLKNMFMVAINKKNEANLHKTILTARQLSHSSPKFGSYYSWYKDNIGEMTYKLNKDDFQYVMKILTRMAKYETSEEVLKVHVETRIQAPLKCNELVLTFKAISKSRLEAIQRNEGENKVVEVISIDS